MSLKLVVPDGCHEQAWRDILAEFKAYDEEPADGLYIGLDEDGYETYLTMCEMLRKHNNLESLFIPQTIYFLMEDGSDEILGQITIRHILNDYLLNIDGHIGYCIRPSKWGKGYATKQLELALDICKSKGMEKVLLTCNSDNYASAAVIKKCGGELENTFAEEDGNIVERYWIRSK